MNPYVIGLGLLLVLAGGGITALFVIQNSSRTTGLSLDLWVVAYQLAEPVSVPALIGVSLLVGAAVVGLPLLFRVMSQGRRVRELEHRLYIAEGQGHRPGA